MKGLFTLRAAALRLAHIDHILFVLKSRFPRAHEMLLVAGYSAILWALHRRRADTDDKYAKVVRAAARPGAFEVVRGEDVWLTLPFLEEITLSRGGVKELPAFWTSLELDQALSTGTLQGFKPIRPIDAAAVLGPFAGRDDTVVLQRRARRDGEQGPLDVAHRPTEHQVEAAWEVLEAEFEGLNRGYVQILILTAFKAQQADGPAPILVVIGDTGSGKGGSQQIVAAMLGGSAQSVRLCDSAKDVARSLGLALSSGAALVYVDEVGRTSGVYAKLEPVLAIHSTFRFDVKYGNEREIPVTAPISLVGSTLPMAITRSPELARRSVGIQLTGHTLNWGQKGPLTRVRDVPYLRSAASTVMAGIWWMVRDLGPSFSWKEIALERFGAVPIAELDIFEPESQAPVIRRLFQLFRTAPDSVLSTAKPGWYDAGRNEGDAWPLLDELLNLDDDRKVVHARKDELGRLDLVPILGFDEPALRLAIESRSKQLCRFKFVVKGLRGSGPPRHKWPHLSDVQVEENRGAMTSRRGRLHSLRCDSNGGEGNGGGIVTSESVVPVSAVPTEHLSSTARDADSSLDRVWGDGVVVHTILTPEGRVSAAGFPTGRLVYWAGPDAPAEVEEAIGSADLVAVFEPLTWSELGLPQPERVVPLSHCARLEGLPPRPAELLLRVGLAHVADNLGRAIDVCASSPLAPHVRRLAAEHVRALAHLMTLRPWPWETSLEEFRVMGVDRLINLRGVPVDVELLRSIYEMECRMRYDLLSRPGVDGVDPRREQEVLARVSELQARGDGEAGIANVSEARAAVRRNTGSKLVTLLAAVEEDGRIRGAFKYAQGRTGRWVSPILHNLPRGSDIDHDAATKAVLAHDFDGLIAVADTASVPTHEVLASLLRKTIAAPESLRFAIGDYSTIEVRVLFWLAEDAVFLDGVAGGSDPYRLLAAGLFSIQEQEVSNAQRALAKPIFLGCMFGMGAETLLKYVSDFGVNWGDFGLDATEVVGRWRRIHGSVAGRNGLWAQLYEAARNTVQLGKAQRVGALRFCRGGDDLLIALPGGRRVRYTNARFEVEGGRDILVYQHRGQRVRLWGSKLAENLTQAVARDLLAETLVQLEKEDGIDVVMHIHDEIVAEVQADRAAEILRAAMETPPKWATGLPLATKVRLEERFG